MGSSGLIHALVQCWRERGKFLPLDSTERPGPVERLVVVSGSCSPVTEVQIRWAMAHGFADIRVDASGCDTSAFVETALTALSRNESVVLYTALGLSDRNAGEGGEKLGRKLGVLLREVLMRSGVRRALVAGGDTSSHAVRQLGIEALTFAGTHYTGRTVMPMPCPRHELDGLELVLKGGQMGPGKLF